MVGWIRGCVFGSGQPSSSGEQRSELFFLQRKKHAIKEDDGQLGRRHWRLWCTYVADVIRATVRRGGVDREKGASSRNALNANSVHVYVGANATMQCHQRNAARCLTRNSNHVHWFMGTSTLVTIQDGDIDATGRRLEVCSQLKPCPRVCAEVW